MSAADDGIPSSQQVDQLLGSSKLALALESDRYKHLLDHAPVAVAVSRGSGGEQHVVYINKAFENLMSMAAAHLEGQSWTCLDGFLNEDSPAQTLGEAIRDGEDFIGVVPPGRPGRSSRHRAGLCLGDRKRRRGREFPDRGAGRCRRPGAGPDRTVRESDPRSRYADARASAPGEE